MFTYRNVRFKLLSCNVLKITCSVGYLYVHKIDFDRGFLRLSSSDRLRRLTHEYT